MMRYYIILLIIIDYTVDLQEVEDLNNKLMFLNKRLAEAEQSHWEGMFKRPPLW